MPLNSPNPADQLGSDVDIEVTSATQTAEEINKANGVTAKPAADAQPVEPSAADISAARETGRKEDVEETGLDAEALEEIDKLEPPPTTKIETKKERRDRIGRQTKKVMKEISRRKTAEGETERERTARLAADAEVLRLRTENEQLRSGKPADGTAAPGGAKPNAGGTKPAGDFDFPNYDNWSKEHPDGDHAQYTIELTDARYAFNREKDRTEQAQKEADTRTRAAFTAAQTFETDFKKEKPDYDEVTARNEMVGTQEVINGKPTFVPVAQIQVLQGELLKLGKNGPRMNYYLGEHPEIFKALAHAPTPADFFTVWGTHTHIALGQASAPAAPAGGDGKPAAPAAPASRATAAAPATDAKPKPGAPDPLAPARGAHSPTRTLTQISADDGEDADSYIAERHRQLEAR